MILNSDYTQSSPVSLILLLNVTKQIFWGKLYRCYQEFVIKAGERWIMLGIIFLFFLKSQSHAQSKRVART